MRKGNTNLTTSDPNERGENHAKRSMRVSSETRKKISATLSLYYKNNPKIMSEATKKKISKAMTKPDASPDLLNIVLPDTSLEPHVIQQRYESDKKTAGWKQRYHMAVSKAKHNGKMTEDKVRLARHLFDSGQLSVVQLQRLFEVAYSTMHNIVYRKSWRHLP